MRNKTVKKIAVVGVMSALSAVLMLIEFPVGLVPGFVKLDFSDVPALIVAFSAGPFWGGAVALIKNLINLATTDTGGVGELANFLTALSLVLPAGITYRYFAHTKKGAHIGCAIGSATMALLTVVINYFLVFPFYAVLFKMDVVAPFTALYPAVDSLIEVVLLVMLPFNLVKALLVSLVTVIIYKKLSPLLK